MIHPSMQPGFHPNTAFWVVVAAVIVFAAFRLFGRSS